MTKTPDADTTITVENDLIKRLRAVIPYQGNGSGIAFLCHEAADRLQAAEAEVERLRGALEPFALADNLDDGLPPLERLRIMRGMVSLENFDRARQALLNMVAS